LIHFYKRIIFRLIESTSTMEEVFHECRVCHLPMDRERIHYGGSSCYSCRAFFRRKTQKNDLTSCKLNQKCKISYIERKSCPPCRYEKCKRAGMRSDLVLNEREKNQRFKRHKKKEDVFAESDDEEDNVCEMGEVVYKSKKRFIHDKEIGKKRLDQTSKQTLSYYTKPWETVILSDSESEHEIDNLWPEVEEKDTAEKYEDESFLDPETGLMVNPTDNQENVDDIKEGENDNSDQIKAKVRSDTNSISKCEGTSNAIRCSVITKKSISPVQGTNEELILSDNNKKMKYVHKKFGVAAVKEHYEHPNKQQYGHHYKHSLEV